MRHGMKIVVVVALLALCPAEKASSAVIERNLHYTLGTISGVFGEGQTLTGVSTFFPDDTFVLGVGDTLILHILFDAQLEVVDQGDPTDEAFSWALNIVPDSLRIPAKPGHHSDACEAIIPVHAGPVVKRLVDCRRCR